MCCQCSSAARHPNLAAAEELSVNRDLKVVPRTSQVPNGRGNHPCVWSRAGGKAEIIHCCRKALSFLKSGIISRLLFPLQTQLPAFPIQNCTASESTLRGFYNKCFLLFGLLWNLGTNREKYKTWLLEILCIRELLWVSDLPYPG